MACITTHIIVGFAIGVFPKLVKVLPVGANTVGKVVVTQAIQWLLWGGIRQVNSTLNLRAKMRYELTCPWVGSVLSCWRCCCRAGHKHQHVSAVGGAVTARPSARNIAHLIFF